MFLRAVKVIFLANVRLALNENVIQWRLARRPFLFCKFLVQVSCMSVIGIKFTDIQVLNYVKILWHYTTSRLQSENVVDDEVRECPRVESAKQQLWPTVYGQLFSVEYVIKTYFRRVFAGVSQNTSL